MEHANDHMVNFNTAKTRFSFWGFGHKYEKGLLRRESERGMYYGGFIKIRSMSTNIRSMDYMI